MQDKIPTDAVVLYHGNCADGFGAALCAWMVLGDRSEYVPCTHFSQLPDVDVAGKDVFILDFSFAPELLVQMEAVAKSITLLDHHVSAQRKLAGHRLSCCGKLHFDLGRSGAMLAWDHFNPGKEAPALIRFIQDGDLWQWKERGSEDFLAWLHSKPHDFQGWMRALNFDQKDLDAVMEQGRALRAQFTGLCEQICENSQPVTVCGQNGLMVNANHMFASQVGAMLAQKCGTFALIWRVGDTPELRCSLRSVNGYDVEAIAVQFGGGGHRQACAFRLPIARIMDLVNGDLNA